MQPRWFCAASAVVDLRVLSAIALLGPHQDVVVLERLAPRIERAQMLAPETRDAILQLVDRVRDTTADPRLQERRERTRSSV